MAGLPYDDRRITVDQWEEEERHNRSKYPQGFLPTLEVPITSSSMNTATTTTNDNTSTNNTHNNNNNNNTNNADTNTTTTTTSVILNQPLAIAVFAAQSAGLVRTHPMEEAIIDEVIQLLEELITGKHGLKSNKGGGGGGGEIGYIMDGEGGGGEVGGGGGGEQQQLPPLGEEEEDKTNTKDNTSNTHNNTHNNHNTTTTTTTTHNTTTTHHLTRETWLVNCLHPLMGRIESLVSGDTFFLPSTHYRDPTTPTPTHHTQDAHHGEEEEKEEEEDEEEEAEVLMEYPTLADLWLVAFVDFLASGVVFDIPRREDFEQYPLLMRIIYNVKKIPQIKRYFKRHPAENVVKGSRGRGGGVLLP